ncbi:ribonuclease inhibitor [uncultured Chryseobacterium sp.]|uniref:ribonuclease inhibitor n=1 Tax=uncultured Chryseobacterium sp. TaxID=259322 RepID=UPI0025D871A5|nr:ribonuclease inhibitor [uncultured Chryseobacterium sp.]
MNVNNNNTNNKIIVIQGSHFSDLQGVYEEASKIFMKDAGWKIGTLDGFDDILYGGFGVVENGEHLTFIWKEARKSEQDLGMEATKAFYEHKIHQGKPFNTQLIQQKLDDLINGKGQTLFEILVEIIESHQNITLILN